MCAHWACGAADRLGPMFRPTTTPDHDPDTPHPNSMRDCARTTCVSRILLQVCYNSGLLQQWAATYGCWLRARRARWPGAPNARLGGKIESFIRRHCGIGCDCSLQSGVEGHEHPRGEPAEWVALWHCPTAMIGSRGVARDRAVRGTGSGGEWPPTFQGLTASGRRPSVHD